MKQLKLQDIDEPVLFSGTFPYGEVPRIGFGSRHTEQLDGQEIVFDFSKAVERDLFITDTTFRDGQQARPPFTVAQIVEIYKLLVRLTGDGSVIRNTEFFVYSRKDREAVEACLEVGAEYPMVTAITVHFSEEPMP